MTRNCRHCGLPWPLVFFALVGRRADGSELRRAECKFCRSDRRAELDAGAERRRPFSMRGYRKVEAA